MAIGEYRNFKLYRIPRLRPPVINGVSISTKPVFDVYLIGPFPRIKITPKCFFKSLHKIPKVNFVFKGKVNI